MKRKLLVATSVAAAALVTFFLWLSKPNSDGVPDSSSKSPLESSDTGSHESGQAKLGPASGSPLASDETPGHFKKRQVAPGTEPGEQVKATVSMYNAHASLRRPAIDDPDSEANQRIRERMLLQAFNNTEKE